tara:strand:- start:41 stop:445 length:405 start_codon:yes stop_codon:yes gene_type:complete
MDLMDLKPTSDTIEVFIKDPYTGEILTNDGDGSEMTITVYAPHSKEYKAAVHKQTNKRLKAATRKGSVGSISAEELEESGLALLSETVASWDITFGKEKPKLTIEKARTLFTEVFWIKDQVEEAVRDAEVFTRG